MDPVEPWPVTLPYLQLFDALTPFRGWIGGMAALPAPLQYRDVVDYATRAGLAETVADLDDTLRILAHGDAAYRAALAEQMAAATD